MGAGYCEVIGPHGEMCSRSIGHPNAEPEAHVWATCTCPMTYDDFSAECKRMGGEHEAPRLTTYFFKHRFKIEIAGINTYRVSESGQDPWIGSPHTVLSFVRKKTGSP